MSKNLKFFLGVSYSLILIVFLYLIFSNIQLNRLNDFLYYKELQLNLETYIGKNILINLAYFSIFSIIWIALLGFGSPLTIVSGIIFGKWIGTLISLISISFGALILYSITDFFFKNLIKKILKKKFIKYIKLFKKNEFFYFFIFRFIGGLGIPFFLQNTLPVIFRMKKTNYFFASFLGFVPGFFIFNTIGSGLNNFVKQSNNFSMIKLISTTEVYLPIIMFLCLILGSIFLKKFFFDD